MKRVHLIDERADEQKECCYFINSDTSECIIHRHNFGGLYILVVKRIALNGQCAEKHRLDRRQLTSVDRNHLVAANEALQTHNRANVWVH